MAVSPKNRQLQEEGILVRLRQARLFNAIAQLEQWPEIRLLLGQRLQSALDRVLDETITDPFVIGKARGEVSAFKSLIASVDTSASDIDTLQKKSDDLNDSSVKRASPLPDRAIK